MPPSFLTIIATDTQSSVIVMESFTVMFIIKTSDADGDHHDGIHKHHSHHHQDDISSTSLSLMIP